MPKVTQQFKSAVSCQVTVESKAKGDICETYAACIVKFGILVIMIFALTLTLENIAS